MSAPDPVGPPGPLPPGYQFVRMLGAGGNGWVALARHEVLGRLVAVKTVYGGRHDDGARRRLEREGQALAGIRSDRIVGVYELVGSGEDLMLVMEYVAGGDLSDVAAGLSLTGRLQVLADVAAALRVAAAQGVVHRDIKPANVLVDENGRAKLTDFGIARLARSAAAYRTAASVSSGTPSYVAPEQLTDPDHEAPAADDYSFAVMAYELVVGRRPYRANSVEGLVYSHLSLAPLAPESQNPAITPGAAAALLAGLAKDPAARMSAVQLAAALAELVPGWRALPPETRQLNESPNSLVVSELAPPSASSPAWRGPSRGRSARRFAVPPFVVGAIVVIAIVILIAVLR